MRTCVFACLRSCVRMCGSDQLLWFFFRKHNEAQKQTKPKYSLLNSNGFCYTVSAETGGKVAVIFGRLHHYVHVHEQSTCIIQNPLRDE